MYFHVNNAESFIKVANELGGVTSVIVEETRIVGYKVNDSYNGNGVILSTRLTDGFIDDMLNDTDNQFGHRNTAYNNGNQNPHIIRVTFRGKPGLVRALMTLGVDQKLIAALKTAKVNEMKEFIDATAPQQIPENMEVAEIVLKLSSQSDRHTFKTKSTVIPNITINMEVNGACPTYFLNGDAKKANDAYKAKSLVKIQAALNMVGTAGEVSERL